MVQKVRHAVEQRQIRFLVMSRQWKPCKWDISSRLLVFGEALAFLSATVGAVLWLAGANAPWLFVFAAVVSTFCLTCYAVDLVSQGERPLTPRHVKTIKSIADTARTAERLNLEVDWENPTETEDGSVSFPVDKDKALSIVREMAEGMYGEEAKQNALRALRKLRLRE